MDNSKNKEQLEFLSSLDPKTIKLEDMTKTLNAIEQVRKTTQEEIAAQNEKMDSIANRLSQSALKLTKEEGRELIALIELFCGTSRLQQKDLKNNFTDNFKKTLEKMGCLNADYEWGDSFLNINYDNYLTQLELDWSVKAGKNSGKEFKKEDFDKMTKFDDLLKAIEDKKQEKSNESK